MKSDSKVHNQHVLIPGHQTPIWSCGPHVLFRRTRDPLTSVVDALRLPFSIIRARQGSWGREWAGKLKQKKATKKNCQKNFFWQLSVQVYPITFKMFKKTPSKHAQRVAR